MGTLAALAAPNRAANFNRDRLFISNSFCLNYLVLLGGCCPASRINRTSTSNITVNFQTTAKSALLLTFYFFNADPWQASVILAAIAADPDTTLLAQALKAAWNEADLLSDPTAQAALQKA